MGTIDLDEARAKFGNLIEPVARSYREFETPEGIWRPEFVDRQVAGYRLHSKPPSIKIKKKMWRPIHP
jgi:hypothetical protein